MRAVSTPITFVILIALSILLLGLFWLFITGSFNSLTSSGTSTVSQALTTISSCMKIESVSGNQVFIRNCGKGVITADTLSVYLDDIPLDITSGTTANSIFTDGFESGYLSKWTETCVYSVNSLKITNLISHSGTYSANSTWTTSFREAVVSENFAGQSTIYTRFYLYIPSSIPNNDVMAFMQINNNGFYGTPIAALGIYNQGGTSKWYLWYRDSSGYGIATSTQQTPSISSWIKIELYHQNGVGTASYKVYINGNELTDITQSSKNQPLTVDNVGLGANNNLNSVLSGTIYIDDAVISNSFLGSVGTINEDEAGTISLYGLEDVNPGRHLLRVSNPKVITEKEVEAFSTEQVPSPVLDLEFNEGLGKIAYDSSENGNNGVFYGETFNDGTCNSTLGTCPSRVDGHFGKGLSFDESKREYIQVPNSASLSITGPITVSAWIKTPSNIGSCRIIASKTTTNPAGDPPGPTNWIFHFVASSLHFYVNISGPEIFAEKPITADAWQYVTGTYNGSYIIAWVNGDPGTPIYVGGPLNTVNYPLLIGSRNMSYDYFDGIIDELRIWNRSLTAEEIQAEMNSAYPVIRPVASWRFDEPDSAAYVNDSHIWVKGQDGSALSFDGKDDFVEIGNKPSLNFGLGDFTMEAWIKLASLNYYKGIMTKDNSGAGWYNLHTAWSAGGQAYSGAAVCCPYNDTTSTTTIGIDEWHHLLGFRKADDLVIYIDDVERGRYTHDVVNTIDVSSTAMFRIAARNRVGDEAYWNGTIDSVRVYDEAVTPETREALISLKLVSYD